MTIKPLVSIRSIVALWILVRTFCYATRVLDRLMPITRDPEHIQMLRGVCASLYQQIRQLNPIYGESPTARRMMGNQWP